MLGAIGHLDEVEAETIGLGGGLEHPKALCDDLWADAVTGQDCNAVRVHAGLL
jgi:hypothetical protein